MRLEHQIDCLLDHLNAVSALGDELAAACLDLTYGVEGAHQRAIEAIEAWTAAKPPST